LEIILITTIQQLVIMKNETTMILANKLALYFSSSELNNFESKLEKDIDEIEQMKLDFCDIYRKCI
jgi:hypothetical protein